MRFKVEGVDAETGKKVEPQEIVADDQREAATMAKSLNVLPTKITPITDLVTIELSEPDGDELVEPRRTTLISIDGHPKWFVATLILGLLIAGMWILIPKSQPADKLDITSLESYEAAISDSFYDDPQNFHILGLKSMANVMYMGSYTDSRGYILSHDKYWGYIVGGVAHMFVPDTYPYKMQWRLQSGFPNIKVPVSFLDVAFEGPFSHEVAVEAVKEFYHIAGGDVSIEDVQRAMEEAEALMLSVRLSDPKPSMGSWSVESSLPKTVTIDAPVGSYLVKVSIREWPTEAYLRETGACEVFIFFAYCPPGVTKVASIHSSGF